MKTTTILTLTLLLSLCFQTATAQGYRTHINLAGTWQTELGDVTLPGTTDTNRKGKPIERKTRPPDCRDFSVMWANWPIRAW